MSKLLKQKNNNIQGPTVEESVQLLLRMVGAIQSQMVTKTDLQKLIESMETKPAPSRKKKKEELEPDFSEPLYDMLEKHFDEHKFAEDFADSYEGIANMATRNEEKTLDMDEDEAKRFSALRPMRRYVNRTLSGFRSKLAAVIREMAKNVIKEASPNIDCSAVGSIYRRLNSGEERVILNSEDRAAWTTALLTDLEADSMSHLLSCLAERLVKEMAEKSDDEQLSTSNQAFIYYVMDHYIHGVAINPQTGKDAYDHYVNYVTRHATDGEMLQTTWQEDQWAQNPPPAEDEATENIDGGKDGTEVGSKRKTVSRKKKGALAKRCKKALVDITNTHQQNQQNQQNQHENDNNDVDGQENQVQPQQEQNEPPTRPTQQNQQKQQTQQQNRQKQQTQQTPQQTQQTPQQIQQTPQQKQQTPQQKQQTPQQKQQTPQQKQQTPQQKQQAPQQKQPQTTKTSTTKQTNTTTKQTPQQTQKNKQPKTTKQQTKLNQATDKSDMELDPEDSREAQVSSSSDLHTSVAPRSNSSSDPKHSSKSSTLNTTTETEELLPSRTSLRAKTPPKSTQDYIMD